METVIEKQINKEVNATIRWSVGILITLFLQTATAVWWASGISKQVEQNKAEIASLRSGAAVILTRDQLDDILGVRDARLDNIESSIRRVEAKLDRIAP